jgi:hypothetical protein
MESTHTTNQPSGKKLEDLVRRISALLTQADHPNTGPDEAATFRAKAEALMFQYRIAEHDLKFADPSAPLELPDWTTVVLCDASSHYANYYYSLFLKVTRHLDILCETAMLHDPETGFTNYVAHTVGYESDRRFAQILWQSIRLSFGKNLEPQVDPTLSDAENCYNLRNAGMEGVRIAYLVFGDTAKSNRIKARNLARKWGERIGADTQAFSGRGNNMKLYRESYAQGFLQTIQSRLYEMSRARTIEEAGTMVLASRTEAIKEVFYTRFPHRRPRPAVETFAESSYTDHSNCKKCAAAKSGYCRDHSYMRPRSSGRVRYANSGAMAKGADAARQVNLGITNREVH